MRAVRHTIGCFLARVCGLSPLEYLTEPERRLQKHTGIELAKDPPSTISELTDKFKEHIHAHY
jgi:hypothetical protein